MRAYVFVLYVCFETATSLPPYSTLEIDGWSHVDLDEPWQHLVFKCNESDEEDVIVNLEDETLPWDTGALTVMYCRTVTLTLSQKVALTPLRSLTVDNVDILELVDTEAQPYRFHNPPQVEFRNIRRIPIIPSRTFTSASSIKAESIVLVNVTIGEISSRAFDSVEDASLLMDSVQVTLIDTDAINMENTYGGSMRIINSRFGTLEPRSFVLNSREVAFVGCHIIEIREESLEISTLNFTFHNNTVTEVMAAGFTVSSLNISFVGNRFNSIQSRAFEEVTPPAGNDLMRNNVTYVFVNNYINWAEQGSLQPNFTIYEESRNHTRLQLGNNSFNCTCALVGVVFAMESSTSLTSPVFPGESVELSSTKTTATSRLSFPAETAARYHFAGAVHTSWASSGMGLKPYPYAVGCPPNPLFNPSDVTSDVARLGWLDASIQEEVTPDLRFRSLILQNKDNVCAHTDCRLPVRYVNFLLDSTSSKSCVTPKQVQELCEHTVIAMSSQPTILSSASVVFLSVCCLAYFFS